MSLLKRIFLNCSVIEERDREEFYESFVNDVRINIDLQFYENGVGGFEYRYREKDPVFIVKDMNVKVSDGDMLYRAATLAPSGNSTWVNIYELYAAWKEERGRRTGLSTGIL